MNAQAYPTRRRLDAHHHLWKLGRFPYAWLAPDSAPRPFGDHRALQRDYLLDDYLRDIAGAGVVGSVFVEANAGARAAEEVEWVDEIAANSRLPGAVVGSVDLRRPDAAAILRECRRSSRMRGIRMSVCWDARPQWRFIDRPDVMQSAEFRTGLAALTREGLVLDVLVAPSQLADLARLAAANPDQAIVVDHLGTPAFDTPADRTAWESGMRECARCDNVVVKVSGLWTLDRQWRPAAIAGPVRFVVEHFGPARCMWGSNLPVEKVMCPLHDQLAHLEEVLDDFSEDDRNSIFGLTAARVYRLEDGPDARPAA